MAQTQALSHLIENEQSIHFPSHHPESTDSTSLYKSYASSTDIIYTPEEALREGLNMVSAISSGLDTLDLGTRMRKDVWARTVDE